MEYDPGTKASKVVQPATGKVLTVPDREDGSMFSVGADPNPTFSGWELTQMD